MRNRSDRLHLEHEIERRHFQNTDIGHAQHVGDIFDRRLGKPAFLFLGPPQQRNHRAGLTPLGVFGDLRFGPFLIGRAEGKAFGLFVIQTTKHQRSISPNTMSIVPIMAATSASWWPVVM